MSDPYALVRWGNALLDNMTAAALTDVEALVGHALVVTQGSYNSGAVAVSGGTHDGGGVVDLAVGTDWAVVVHALREVGFAAWRRTPYEGLWNEHIHAVLIGNERLSNAAVNQVVSYFNGGDGLGGADTFDWRPDPIKPYVYGADYTQSTSTIQVWPRGSDTIAGAPEIGFGQSEPTPNNALGPITYDEQNATLEAYNNYYSGQPFQTAWWRFTAQQDGYVSFDLHRSTVTASSIPSWFKGPQTVLSIFLQGPERPEDWLAGSNLYLLDSVEESMSADAVPIYQSEAYSTPLVVPKKPTSQLYIRVRAGWVYYLQAGMNVLYRDPYYEFSEDVETNYILTVKQVTARHYEVVVPSIGPFYNAADGGAQTPPVIVGGDNALLRDSGGYIDLPYTAGSGSSRYGGWSMGFEAADNWPPAPNARMPGMGGQYAGIQIAMRYYAERTDGVLQFFNGYANIDGNAGGERQFSFSTSHYPDLNGRFDWAPGAPAQETDRINHGDDGTWAFSGLEPSSYDSQGHVLTFRHGATSLDEGIVQAVWLTPSEDWLNNGEYQTVIDPTSESQSVEMWFEWWGGWGMPPLANIQYRFDPTLKPGAARGPAGSTVNPADLDFGAWAGSSGQGVEYAQFGSNIRIHWFEWVARWVVYEEDVPQIRGRLVSDRRTFRGVDA